MALEIDLGHARKLSPDDDLVRALGWRKGVLTVVDATGGLGRDAAALARVGFAVIAIERSPALASRWWSALRRGPRNLAFLEGDAREKLRELSAWGMVPDAVYLDPMYPERERRAAQQREMVELRTLVGEDEDAAELLRVALAVAGQRVVVKRPKKAAPLQAGASHTWEGASTRYDLYLTHPASRPSTT